MSRKHLRSNRFLPQFVSRFKSQTGVERFRFRRTGYPGGYFKAALGTEAFREEYHAFMNPGGAQPIEKTSRIIRGTVNDLVTRYVSVPTRLGPSDVTQQKVRAIIEDFAAGRGDRPVNLLTFEAIDKIIAKKAIKTGTGNKTKGGHHAAIKLRKELIRLFDFAMKSGLISHNPVRLSEKVRLPKGTPRGGFHCWTEEEISRYRDHHVLGTRERLAMELILWTDQRRCDVVKMGPAQIVDGRIPVFQEKTGKELWLPVAPQLTEAIDAMSAAETSPHCFLMTVRGHRQFRKESFGNWFKKACVAAGLPHCAAHGLRKATLRRMAELEMANKVMKSVSGQTSDKTLGIYIESANQVKLADSAIGALAAWERGLQRRKRLRNQALPREAIVSSSLRMRQMKGVKALKFKGL